MGSTAQANHSVQSAWDTWIDELQRFLDDFSPDPGFSFKTIGKEETENPQSVSI